MKKEFFMLFSIFILSSCGKKSPFSEGYWEDGGEKGIRIEEQNIETFNVTLNSVIADQTLSGTVVLDINLEDINIQVNLLDVPTNIDIVRFSVSALTCDEIRANGPPAPVSENKYKNFSFTETGKKNDFINSLNQGQIRDNNLVIYGLFGSNLPGQVNLVFPLACGPIRKLEE